MPRLALGTATRAAPALLLLGLALLPALMQLWRGVSLPALNSGYDTDFAITTARVMLEEVEAGRLLPHWAAADHAGFGSPIFYYYAPFAWLLAAPFALAGLPLDKALVAALLLARAAAFAGGYAWARTLVADRRLATLAAALFVLAPYVALNLPMQRFAYAECVAIAFVPLCLLNVDLRGPALTRILAAAAGYAGLAMTHMPTTILAAVIVPAYALAARGPWRCAEVVAGGALGTLLAGVLLAPAALLQNWTAMQWLLPDLLTFRYHALFAPDSLQYLRAFWDLGSRLLVHIAWAFDVLALWLLARHWRELGRTERGLAEVLGLSLLLMCWPFALLLAKLPALRNVQFPWRALGVVAALAGMAAALAAWRQPALRPWLLAAAVLLAVGQATVPVLDRLLPAGTWSGRRWLLPQFAASSAARLAEEQRIPTGQPEYLTRWADAAGWPPGRSPDPAAIMPEVDSRTALPAYGAPAVVEGEAKLEVTRSNGRFAFAGR
ncbi:MAG TPA: hypothetical protein VE684_09680, partial [Crenalkalicoccus sp.]|nr:hypothetical protein [Crenalkalicoccus sp.]